VYGQAPGGENRRHHAGRREFQSFDVSPETEAMASLVTDSGRKTPARLAGSAILAVQSDEHLVRLVRDGHERAFDAIVARYRRPLIRFAGRFLPESRTEDAVQQAFINAHGALVGSDEPVNLKPWLFAITRNASLNMVRQNGWNYEQIPLDFDGVRRPDQVVEQRIELQRTVAAVNELPDRQRDALVMREFEGRSYDEIALALGANDGAVRQLLNRARGAVRAAAALLTPPPLVARAAASLPPSDGRRLSEVLGGLGAAGVAKAGATALVAGTLVVGAVDAPLPIVGGSKHSHDRATPKANDAAHKTPISRKAAAVGPSAGSQLLTRREDHHGSSGHGRSGPSGRHEAEREHSGSGVRRHHSGSDDGARQPSGSGEHRSGSGDRGGTGSGGGTRSGSDDSTHSGSGSGSGTSGGSGDTPLVTRSGETSGGGSDDGVSGSETSGSGTSGSGTSGSGTSGSGDSGSGSVTSSSGSSGSGTSGSGTSGSDDPLTDSH
jgi:RNA polymerase sigma factor (sigma-70 family)